MTSTIDTRRLRTRRRRSDRRRLVGWVLSGCAVVILAAIASLAVRGMLAKQDLEAAAELGYEVREQISAGDMVAAARSSKQFALHAQRAASLTDGPIWRSAETVPWLGPNLEVLRVITESVEGFASGAALPLVEAAVDLDITNIRPSNNRVAVERFAAAREPVRHANVAVSEALTVITHDRVVAADVIAPLTAARSEVSRILADASDAIRALDRSVQLVPLMLGEDEPRNVMLLFQNNAELRSTGGIAGAVALLRTEGGAFQLVKQANTIDFGRFEPPVAQLPVETRALYGDNTASYIQDVNFTPQFPLAASLAREMWEQRFEDEVHSVVALDPVVLSYLLGATGPVALPSGDVITSENAVQLLLRDVYSRYPDPATQDQFFAETTSTIIDAISGTGVDSKALIEAFVRAGIERRILIWNADPAEQDILAGTTLAGGLPISTHDAESFGVYFNDMTGAKMGPYLDIELAAGAVSCRADGRANYLVEVSLSNVAPADAGTALPPYVRGIGRYGTPPGNISTSVHVYSAPGNFNLGVRRNGSETSHHPSSDSGYTLSKVVSRLAPGESETFTFAFLAGIPGQRPPVVESTPLINAVETFSLHTTCENAVW